MWMNIDCSYVLMAHGDIVKEQWREEMEIVNVDIIVNTLKKIMLKWELWNCEWG